MGSENCSVSGAVKRGSTNESHALFTLCSQSSEIIEKPQNEGGTISPQVKAFHLNASKGCRYRALVSLDRTQGSASHAPWTVKPSRDEPICSGSPSNSVTVALLVRNGFPRFYFVCKASVRGGPCWFLETCRASAGQTLLCLLHCHEIVSWM